MDLIPYLTMLFRTSVPTVVLLRLTRGPAAKALIKGCRYLPREFSFNAFHLCLQQTFGQTFHIVIACIENVTNDPAQNQNDKKSSLSFRLNHILVKTFCVALNTYGVWLILML